MRALLLAALIATGPPAMASESRADRREDRADLAVTAVAENETRSSASVVTFRVTVTNNGPKGASSVLLEAIVAPEVIENLRARRVEASNGGRCRSDVLVCELGDLPPDESVTINLVGRVEAARPVSIGLEFRVTSNAIDSAPFNNRYYSATFLSNERTE